jgi:hypothetical protein
LSRQHVYHILCPVGLDGHTVDFGDDEAVDVDMERMVFGDTALV